MKDKGISNINMTWIKKNGITGNVHVEAPICLLKIIWTGSYAFYQQQKMTRMVKYFEEGQKNFMPSNSNVGCSKPLIQLIEIIICSACAFAFAKKKWILSLPANIDVYGWEKI